MKALLAGIAALALGAAGTSGPIQAQQLSPKVKALVGCDRNCLKGIADRYFTALLKHSPQGLPLDAGARMTENASPVKIGQGVLWRALTKAPGAFRIDVIDPVSGQIAVGGLLEIDGKPNLASLRFKVTGGRIVEIEQFFSDAIQPVGLPNLKAPRAALLADVPASRRNSRAEMQIITESYFDALTSEDSSKAPIGEDCIRHEGGIQTTGNKEPLELAMPLSAPKEELARMKILMRGMTVKSCAGQIDSGLFADLWKVWPRRPVVIDEEKGLVAAFPLFIQNGDVRPSPLKGYPGVDRIPSPLPSESQKLEIFKIHSGQIHEIEAVVFVPLKFGATNGWDEGSGQ
ncbi:hypothetical protein WSK_3235 [Novosphingobium sp. Rr 2-17]|uniref:hypothetical protein n=1 Tax=Novosphingobium sp. Rr 2-17 TaxID=555793 RepID=UPI00026988DB|nr:hypothetical protein [Novosphingobium sp. Rr 2-17]EIZ78194.1 hypothetical protein WSK_3235 [Novosphingobium sp. Rr 2-17]